MEKTGAKIKGHWDFECRDSYGNLKWTESVDNLTTNEGLDHILNVTLHATTQITAWYVAPFSTDTTILATHTYASPGYTESTAYSEATRQAYTEAASSSQSVTNSANKARITSNATQTIYGSGLVGGGSAAPTKGDAAGGGTLLCAVKFSASRSLLSGDTLDITYTISSTDDGV